MRCRRGRNGDEHPTDKGGIAAGQARLDAFLIVIIEHIDRVAIAKVKRVSTEQPREPKRSKE